MSCVGWPESGIWCPFREAKLLSCTFASSKPCQAATSGLLRFHTQVHCSITSSPLAIPLVWVCVCDCNKLSLFCLKVSQCNPSLLQHSDSLQFYFTPHTLYCYLCEDSLAQCIQNPLRTSFGSPNSPVCIHFFFSLFQKTASCSVHNLICENHKFQSGWLKLKVYICVVWEGIHFFKMQVILFLWNQYEQWIPWWIYFAEPLNSQTRHVWYHSKAEKLKRCQWLSTSLPHPQLKPNCKLTLTTMS